MDVCSSPIPVLKRLVEEEMQSGYKRLSKSFEAASLFKSKADAVFSKWKISVVPSGQANKLEVLNEILSEGCPNNPGESEKDELRSYCLHKAYLIDNFTSDDTQGLTDQDFGEIIQSEKDAGFVTFEVKEGSYKPFLADWIKEMNSKS